MAGTNSPGGWRGNDGAGGKRPTSDGRRPGWGDAPKAKTAGPRVSKNVRRMLAVGAIGVVLGLVVLLIWLLRPPKSAALVLVGTKHDTNPSLEYNGYGWKALLGVQEVTGNAPSESGLSRWWSARFTLKKGPDVQEFADKFDTSWTKVGEETVVVFLAMHGGADSNGAFFFTENGDELRLETVLDAFKGPELADKKKVLILDPTQIVAHPARGMLYNDFVRRLKEKEADFARLNLIVLCASDQDQRSWVSEEWGQSAFAHFVIEGLKGAAKKGDKGMVRLGDLQTYVSEEVTRWAAANRNAVQTPIILPADSSRSIDLVMIDQPYTGPDQKSRDEEDARKNQWEADQGDLKSEWSNCNRLRSAVPSPVVYSPQLWREYRETLLRYEQVIRAGDPTGAKGTLSKRLDSQRSDIESARRATAEASLRAALPMPAALGKASLWWEKNNKGEPRATEVRKLFDEFETAPKVDRAKAWKALEDWAKNQQPAADVNLHLHLVRLRVTDLLLRRLTEQKVAVTDLTEAREKLELIWKPDPAAPIKAHTLVILLRNLDRNLPATAPEVIRQVLRVRLLAEEVALATAFYDDLDKPETYNANADRNYHPYSEQVFAWVKERVDQADALRFEGENLLFTAQETDWKDAGKKLGEAEKQYLEAGREAAVVRQALSTRDRVLAELPYYSRWLAQQRVVAADKIKRAENCWEATHKLAVALEKPKTIPFESLSSLTRTASDPFDELAREFHSYCEELKKKDVHTQETWQALEGVLVVPVFPDAEERLALLVTLRGISRGLKEGTAGKATAPDTAREARDSAQRQGRLALAALGSRLLKDDEKKLRGWIETSDEGDPGRASLVKAGEGVRDTYVSAAKDSEAALKESTKAEDVAKSADTLTRSAALFRLLDPAVPLPSSSPPMPWTPVEGERRCRMHGLLLWQTERTLRDRWASDGGPEPYFYATGLQYVADARASAVADPADQVLTKLRQVAAGVVSKDLGEAKEMIVVMGPARLAITDQPTVAVPWSFDKKKAPRGTITVWREATGSLLGKNEKESIRQALRVREDSDWPPKPVSYDLLSDPQPADATIPEGKQGSVVLHGVYRGHLIEGKVEIVVQQVADIVATHYPEVPKAGVYVYGDEDAYDGSLCIVLDASGSMNDKLGDKGLTKFKQATAALEEVLREMPPGTKASIWVFGHENPTKDVTIERFPANPKDTFDPSVKTALQKIMREINALTPTYRSPIIRTMLEAHAADLKTRSGIKTLLTLTDGDDSDYKGADDKVSAAQKKKANDALAALDRPDTFVGVVTFGPSADEWENGKKQIGAAIDDYKNARGLFEKVPDIAVLKAKLRQAMIPKLKLYQNDRLVGPSEGLSISFPREQDRKELGEFESYQQSPALLVEGEHTGKVYDKFSTKLDLHFGDRMFLRIKKLGNKFELERALMAETPPYCFGKDLRLLPSRQTNDENKSSWLAALYSKRLIPEVGAKKGEEQLDVLVSVESRDVRAGDGGRITQRRPSFVWFDVQGNGRKMGALSWANEPDFPAAVWRVNRGLWDSADTRAPRVELWYRPDGELVSHCTVKTEVPSVTQQPVRLDVKGSEEKVTIESVLLEKLTVKRLAGKEATPTDCLVVRLSYADKRPVLVRLQGHTRGQQHRYYSEANKVTAIFYEVQIAKTRTLELVSVEAAKSLANEKTHGVFDITLDDGPNRRGPLFKPAIEKVPIDD